MKKVKRYSLLFLAILLMVCCENQMFDVEEPSLIVVDGWIEEGKFATVILTRSTPYFSIVDSDSYINLVETYASVSVSDGIEKEYLTLTIDESQFPKYVYKTTSMKGEVGKTYYLEVKKYDTLLTASTIILPAPKVDTAWFEPIEDDDSLGVIKMQFTDNPETKDYYRILAKTSSENRYSPVMSSVIDDKYFSKSQHIYPLIKSNISREFSQENFYFKKGDLITIKFCAIDHASFLFWNTFQVEALNAVNPFASSSIELTSNIQGNGIGIWSGAGVTYYQIGIK